MKFSIITPTYKRPEKLQRAVHSLLSQTYTDWEMIIVNDSPLDITYAPFSSSINDARIHYHVNDKNRGVNFSRNLAIDKISADSTWVIFLDDDDYFAPDTLQTFHDLILTYQDQKWFVTNRAQTNGKPLTQFPKDDSLYSYAWEYLLLKRCKGDATHCIETKLLIHSKIKFSTKVKQGEEWFFFYQVGLLSKIYYHDHNSTITDGYEISSGLNYRTRTKEERMDSIQKLFTEGFPKKLYMRATFILYLCVRTVLVLIK